MKTKRCFPCWACKGQGGWYDDTDYYDFGINPRDCSCCDGNGMIQIGGEAHRRMAAESIALKIIKFVKPDREEWSYDEILDIGNKALNILNNYEI